MDDEKKTWRKGPLAVAAALALTGGAVAVAAFPGIASAGEQQSATAEGVCDGDVGVILVEIIDSFSTTYEVFIDGVLVTEEPITDTDGQVIAFAPYADGDHTVVVVEYEASGDPLLDTIVELECAADVTTTVPPTTAVAVAAAAATSPTFTG